MIRIGLLSDTHGYVPPRLLELFEDRDEIWHAGDWGTIAIAEQLETLGKPLKGVYGNIDGQDVRMVYPKDLIFQCEGIKVYITHIGGYPGRYSLDAKALIEQNKPDLFIAGHSHILKVMRDPKNSGLLHINPGAAGSHGFHKMKTAVRFSIDGDRITDLEAIELGPRAVLL